ncbi:serine/threonine-protein phosphatase 6 regulatory ankyrin repeat subunit B-like [Coturnix japonica]|uniref:serine/threonine-protein phosphatase 6 regulatory ankyrin repeat subunit B-like n=1 Tax=Coturnix japonica TaxID=93934 RepID=UPI000777CCBB|nr:serine/threonine-protein phosphatase 6 regulatory ankyrin repeat subunit B-like [Coturnix japonica]XP_015726119.1 serine/threonine-protein phosphatase 6 regulatory ankyrin repeat subunit B-like [Coturnix japonica]XP_032302065.1 serine/threonine-protein phosphatase 6 regulatory ankyrin repeat subunit B-like [Coturnix japonica]
MHSSSLFTNPYAIEVLRTKREELIEGINDPDRLLSCLIDNGIFPPEKRMVMSFYRTRTGKNSRVVDILISQGERACRLFFYPCLKQVEPKLYNEMRKYVNEVNERVRDARRQLIGYLLERDKVWFEKSYEQYQEERGSPRRKRQEGATKKKGKETLLSGAAKPRERHSDIGIFDAAAKGCISDLEKALKDNDINALNSSGETLLHVAASQGHLNVMEYLISKGAKLDVMDQKGRTPLHRAAEKGHGDAAKALLHRGAHMYSLDKEGKTPLHLAAQNNHSHIVKMFLRKEARSNGNQHHFLHMAALKDESSLAKMLLKCGASADGKDERGQTALSYAVSQGFENTAEVLLEAGASVDSSVAERAFNSKHPSIFKTLLEHSKDLPSHVMESALFKAVQKNLHGIVAALADRGTDINAYNEMKYTPLLLACETGKAECAEVLIEKGAHLGIKTPTSDTALHLAVRAGAASIANLLLHKGIEANVTNQADETPLHIAALHNHGALVGPLVGAGAKINAVTKEFVTPLHTASQRGNADVAKQLLQHKANVNAKDKQSKSPLHFASERGDKIMVEMLLNANADPNAQDKEKKTPLHAAALRGHLSIAQVLLAKKGRLGVKDMDGCTPVHYAAIKGNTELVKILLTSGKNKNIDDRNIWRKTALHIAAECGHSDLINLLLSYGAAINALDSNKDTPLHCACKAGHLNAVNSLLNWSQGEKANLQAANGLKKTPLQVAECNKTENQAQIVTVLKRKMLMTK